MNYWLNEGKVSQNARQNFNKPQQCRLCKVTLLCEGERYQSLRHFIREIDLLTEPKWAENAYPGQACDPNRCVM